jgi:hypothetical protein
MTKKTTVRRPRKDPTNAAHQRAYRKRLRRSVRCCRTTDLWEMPPARVNTLHAEGHATTDVCALLSKRLKPAYTSPWRSGDGVDGRGTDTFSSSGDRIRLFWEDR